MSAIAISQQLIIDADDTLWENNVYFERAFDEFVDFLAHSTLSAASIRAVLDEIESANARIHGYGSRSFGRNLRQCYERLSERSIADDDLGAVMGFAERILEQPMRVIDGVVETLEYLSARHELTLFTKGHPDEQTLKIDRSGLRRFFAHTAVVPEKDVAAYTELVGTRGLAPERSWMIGNSPKSDINPALAAGLNAVFVPHAHTWTLERQEIRTGSGRLLVIDQFRDLQKHF
jgi:putative hydrolase of the HAD superfamily